MRKVDTGAYSPTASGDAADAVANGVTAAMDSAKPPAMNGRDAGSKGAPAGGLSSRCAAAGPLASAQPSCTLRVGFCPALQEAERGHHMTAMILHTGQGDAG